MQVREHSVSVNRVEQSTPYYCGAACASMTCDKYGTTLLQAAAYELIRTHVAESDSWYCVPDGMVVVLNTSFQPDYLSLNIQSYQSGDAAALLTRVLHNLSRLQFPTPILINGGAHWVIVDGMRLTEGGDAGANILGVYLVDPGPNEPALLRAGGLHDVDLPQAYSIRAEMAGQLRSDVRRKSAGGRDGGRGSRHPRFERH